MSLRCLHSQFCSCSVLRRLARKPVRRYESPRLLIWNRAPCIAGELRARDRRARGGVLRLLGDAGHTDRERRAVRCVSIRGHGAARSASCMTASRRRAADGATLCARHAGAVDAEPERHASAQHAVASHRPQVQSVAIANPQSAPYGRAAMQALTSLALHSGGSAQAAHGGEHRAGGAVREHGQCGCGTHLTYFGAHTYQARALCRSSAGRIPANPAGCRCAEGRRECQKARPHSCKYLHSSAVCAATASEVDWRRCNKTACKLTSRRPLDLGSVGVRDFNPFFCTKSFFRLDRTEAAANRRNTMTFR